MANAQARHLRKTMTPQEVKLWVRLRALRPLGFHFPRQSPIFSYIVDFDCRRQRLVLEVDGGQHGMDDGRIRDSARDLALRAAGYQVLRFWNHEIDRELDGVMQTIQQALVARSDPHLAALRATTLPFGEG
jgi:very-short-patch-repair endonuclease